MNTTALTFRPMLARAAAVLALCAALPCAADPAAPAQAVQLPAGLVERLPPLGKEWRAENPYRGDAKVADVGRIVFNAACSTCHGLDGDATRHVGNDLRLLDIYCHQRIKDAATRAHCVRDNDDFFRVSVLEGKARVGVTHMPSWNGVLSQEALWSIRTFLESRRPEQQR